MFPSPHHRLRSATFCAMFFLLLFTGLSGILRPSEETQENRALAPRPTLGTDAVLLDYPQQFNDYAADHFGGRSWLVFALNTFKLRVLGVSGHRDVLVGKQGWLFLSDDLLERDIAGEAPFTEDELHRWQNYLETRRDRLREKGIDYVFMIVPDKHTAYPEFLPARLHRDGRTRREQLTEHISQRSDVRLLDVTADVFAADKRQPLYFKHDTHWSDVAAYAAYVRLVQRLQTRLPVGNALTPDAFDVSFGPAPLAVLSRFLGMENALPDEFSYATLKPAEPKATLTTIEEGQREILQGQNSQTPLTRALVYRDSFFDPLVPWLAEHFSTTTFIRCPQERLLSEDDLRRFRPDVVIEEIVERKLRTLPVPTP